MSEWLPAGIAFETVGSSRGFGLHFLCLDFIGGFGGWCLRDLRMDEVPMEISQLIHPSMTGHSETIRRTTINPSFTSREERTKKNSTISAEAEQSRHEKFATQSTPIISSSVDWTIMLNFEARDP